MEKVRDEVLEAMLKDYKPLYKFLKQAEYEDKLKAHGLFQAPLNWFFDGEGEFGHFTDAERVFCFNQLGYVLLAEAFERGDVPNAPTIPLNIFYHLQKNSSYVVGSNNILYKKPIISTSPFQGKIEITNSFLKKNGELIFFDMAYDFEDGKATGQVRSAIVLRDLEKIVTSKNS